MAEVNATGIQITFNHERDVPEEGAIEENDQTCRQIPTPRSKPAQHLVVDSNCFMFGTDLSTLSDNIYTIPEVIEEIKDPNTRRSISVLPYKLNIVPVDRASIKKIISITKRIGDYYSLSLTDVKLLALLYKLGCEHLGENMIEIDSSLPIKSSYVHKHKKSQIESTATSIQDNSINLHNSEDDNPPETIELTNVHSAKISDPLNVNEHKSIVGSKLDSKDSVPDNSFLETLAAEDTHDSIHNLPQSLSDLNLKSPSDTPWQVVKSKKKVNYNSSKLDNFNSADFDRWITPDNIDKVLMGRCTDPALRYKDTARDIAYNYNSPELENTTDTADNTQAVVACCTSDYAIQNITLLMGLGLISPSAKFITHVRTYVLRCHGCYTITRDFTKLFCPNCGGNTLLKVTAEIDEDANIKLYLKKNFNYRTRGTIYPIPLPISGKHSNNLILREGQREHQMAVRKKKIYKLLELTDYTQILEPLKLPPKVVVGYGKLNPNEVSYRIPRRKK